jgi:hypothetical protein
MLVRDLILVRRICAGGNATGRWAIGVMYKVQSSPSDLEAS